MFDRDPDLVERVFAIRSGVVDPWDTEKAGATRAPAPPDCGSMSTLPNVCASSTTFITEEVKIRRPAGPKETARAERGPQASGVPPVPRGWRDLTRRDWRKVQGLRMRYVHGPDPQVEIEARGRVWRYAWDTAVLDILADVCNRGEGREC